MVPICKDRTTSGRTNTDGKEAGAEPRPPAFLVDSEPGGVASAGNFIGDGIENREGNYNR